MTQEDQKILSDIAANDRIAREIVHLALGHGHLLRLRGASVCQQQSTLTWVNGVRFNLAPEPGLPERLFHEEPEGFWGKASIIVLCAQLITTLGIQNYAIGEPVSSGEPTEWSVYHRLTLEGCTELRQTCFYRECLKSLGDGFARELTLKTPLYSDYLEVFGLAGSCAQS